VVLQILFFSIFFLSSRCSTLGTFCTKNEPVNKVIDKQYKIACFYLNNNLHISGGSPWQVGSPSRTKYIVWMGLLQEILSWSVTAKPSPFSAISLRSWIRRFEASLASMALPLADACKLIWLEVASILDCKLWIPWPSRWSVAFVIR